jgi:phosphoglycolate phosphatase-like HAD superfamily hydrolase
VSRRIFGYQAIYEQAVAQDGAMRAQGIIFDFDGTIADTWRVSNIAFKATFRRFVGREIEDDELFTYAGPIEDVIVQKMVPHAPDQAVEYFFAQFAAAHETCTEPFPGILPLLSELQDTNVRRSVVTAKGPRAASITFSKIPLKHYFENIHTASLTITEKAPRISGEVKNWRLSPSQVVYVGDTVSDMREAQKAGVVPVGAVWGGVGTSEELLAAGAVATLASPGQLMSWLRGEL